MTQLLNAAPQTIDEGFYNVRMVMTTGDARLQLKVGSEATKDIPDTIKTADDSFNISIPAGNISTLITGNGTVFISLISR